MGGPALENGEESIPFNTAYWIGHEEKTKTSVKGEDTQIIVDKVIPFIKRAVKKETPFFTTVWTHAPHLPVVASTYYRNKYKDLSLKEQLYYGAITALDDQIGRLWQTIEEQGIQNNTMIWFCSDNGPENKTPGSTGTFRERKRSLYEGGLRSPAFVVWEGHLEGGKRIKAPMVTSDYLPTILGVLGKEYPDDRPLDGIDVMPLLKGAQQSRKQSMGFLY